MQFAKNLLCVIYLTVACIALAETTPLYRNPDANIEERVTDLLGQLTLEEKVNLCHGDFTSGGIPRLGIDPLLMLDGRQGLRPMKEEKDIRTTSMPCVLSLSCTWDPKAASEFGSVLAKEMLGFNRHVLLAPMLNLVRSPLGGRNFENFGEDPYLVGMLGSAYIKGVQDKRVAACSCLLVANDCERRRHSTSSNMDERTLRELHLLTYEMSVRDGNVWSIMSGNNLYNGLYCAQNKHLLQEIMKDEIGFDGVMITDWRAAYDTVPAALAGTDMTTGICGYVFGDGNLLKAVKAGDVSQSLLEDKVRRVLRLYIRCGVLDKSSLPKGGIDTPEHRLAARRLAAEGMVLLKNEKQVLPLNTNKIKTILLTGPAADKVLQGGGSGHVPSSIEISPLQGLQSALSDSVHIEHIPYTVNLHPEVKKAKQDADKIPSASVLTAKAKEADAVIFVAAGIIASEGRDLLDMNLPGKQAESITALTKTNPNVIVVLLNSGAVSCQGWGDKVQSILAIHYSGQATGEALADVLTGKVNPGGKLTYTFAKRLKDYPVHALDQWPAKLILDKEPPQPGFTPKDRKATHAYTTEYKEGVFAGYRWFDEKNIEPLFAFGYGLSYTTFEMGDLKVKGERNYTVTCTVKNTGSVKGSEVVQVYITPAKSSVPRPPKELKGFAKVELNPGESRVVEIPLRESALAYYDVESKKWKANAGEYKILVGNSSRDLPLRSSVTLSDDAYYPNY